MKSQLFTDASPFTQPPECQPCRTEVIKVFRKDGRLYRVVIRDKVTVEDPYLVMVKAYAFAVGQGEPYMGQMTSRAVRDFLIKTDVVI